MTSIIWFTIHVALRKDPFLFKFGQQEEIKKIEDIEILDKYHQFPSRPTLGLADPSTLILIRLNSYFMQAIQKEKTLFLNPFEWTPWFKISIAANFDHTKETTESTRYVLISDILCTLISCYIKLISYLKTKNINQVRSNY